MNNTQANEIGNYGPKHFAVIDERIGSEVKTGWGKKVNLQISAMRMTSNEKQVPSGAGLTDRHVNY